MTVFASPRRSISLGVAPRTSWYSARSFIHTIAPHFRESAKAEREAGKEVFRKIVSVSSMSGTTGNAGQAN